MPLMAHPMAGAPLYRNEPGTLWSDLSFVVRVLAGLAAALVLTVGGNDQTAVPAR